MALFYQQRHFASGKVSDAGHDRPPAGLFRGPIARAIPSFLVASLVIGLPMANALAQGTDDPTVAACKSTGLLALQEKSKDITDLVIDLESVAVSKSDTKVEDVPIKTVVLGEAYIARNGKTGAADRFVCLLGDKGKVLLTFFTAK